MTLRDRAATMGRESGHTRPPIDGLTEDDQRSVVYYLLFPNTLISLHPDYVMLHTLWPRAFNRTEVVCEWFFEPATMQAPACEPSDAVGFWAQVSREYANVSSATKTATPGSGSDPGRFISREFEVLV